MNNNTNISIDPVWNKLHKNGWGKYPSESLVRFLCRYKKSEPSFKKNNKILDLGCGGGANTKMMTTEGFNVYALDGSVNAVAHAKKFVGSKKVKFTVADFLEIQSVFPKEFFDIVCDNVCVYANTLPNIAKILEGVSVITKKNGLFYSACFSVKTPGYGLGEKLEPGTFTNITSGTFKNRGVSHFYTEKEARKVYGKFFKIESFDTEEYTEFNGKNQIVKFILICRKK